MDYRDTLNLPNTKFSMRAGLITKEPAMINRWQTMDLSQKILDQQSGKTPFVLHDGPPYANGHLHMGHGLNKILKDIVCRSQTMGGRYVYWRHGWDCHGLPIEWKVEEAYKKKKIKKDEVPILQRRADCRDFARKWIDVQKAEGQRLGVGGDFDNPYLTLTHEAESGIVAEMGKFLLSDQLVRQLKPVFWSVVEQTSLADAEVEYHDKTSKAIYIAFPVTDLPQNKDIDLANLRLVIWTTTPWTIPANRALAYAEDGDYVVLQTQNHGDLIIANGCVKGVMEALDETNYTQLHTLKGTDLAGAHAAHPWASKGYTDPRPLLPADHVETTQGTGFVHMAPDHGEEDFLVCQAHNINPIETVGPDGVYRADLPLVAGQHIFKITDFVLETLNETKSLLKVNDFVHSYPHSWRSKAPVIYRAVPQWFIPITDQVRADLLKAADTACWLPAIGHNRIVSMLKNRPDWNISRQRVWGVPIALFRNTQTGEILRDEVVMNRITEAFRQDGADAWYSDDPRRFLTDQYNKDDYTPIYDILDVWFESGCTHSFVLEADDKLSAPADLYLEGSDQHRGWFQSSLIESVMTRGQAPFKAVLTHGFVVDGQGRKMSKSLGNGMDLGETVQEYGADIVRLWVVRSNYTDDLRISPEILKQIGDTYRKLRNTLRFLIGNLHGFDPQTPVVTHGMTDEIYATLPKLERHIMGRLAKITEQVTEYNKNYDFQGLYEIIYQFCSQELSAFYFDIRKDYLYCGTAQQRHSSQWVLHHVFEYLIRWLAPVLPFTTEEAYGHRHGYNALETETDHSIHLQSFLTAPAHWQDTENTGCLSGMGTVRSVVLGALEQARQDGVIGSSLEAAVTVHQTSDNNGITTDQCLTWATEKDWSEFTIVSAFSFSQANAEGFSLPDVPGLSVTIAKAPGQKCERCWTVSENLTSATNPRPQICPRCDKALG